MIITSVPGVHFADAADMDKQLDYLASRLYGGGGSHGVFSKTVGAGLAYSNGLRGSVSSGRVGYYAERTPELPQTVRFVIGVVKDGTARPHPRRVRDRAGLRRIARLADLRGARRRHRRRPGRRSAARSGAALSHRHPRPCAAIPASSTSSTSARTASTRRLLPGYDAKGLDRSDGSFFVIGPDKQLDAWEQYLREVDGPGGAPAAALRA